MKREMKTIRGQCQSLNPEWTDDKNLLYDDAGEYHAPFPGQRAHEEDIGIDDGL